MLTVKTWLSFICYVWTPNMFFKFLQNHSAMLLLWCPKKRNSNVHVFVDTPPLLLLIMIPTKLCLPNCDDQGHAMSCVRWSKQPFPEKKIPHQPTNTKNVNIPNILRCPSLAFFYFAFRWDGRFQWVNTIKSFFCEGVDGLLGDWSGNAWAWVDFWREA